MFALHRRRTIIAVAVGGGVFLLLVAVGLLGLLRGPSVRSAPSGVSRSISVTCWPKEPSRS